MIIFSNVIIVIVNYYYFVWVFVVKFDGKEGCMCLWFWSLEISYNVYDNFIYMGFLEFVCFVIFLGVFRCMVVVICWFNGL